MNISWADRINNLPPYLFAEIDAKKQALIDKGADKNAVDNEGGTALDGVLLPWNQAKGIYDVMNSIFAPLGAPLDYDRIKSTRPEIVDILRK